MQRRILIIDDHNDLAEALQEVFVHQGHDVRTVEDRMAALAIDNIYSYDLIITDLDVENLTLPSGNNGNSAVCLPKDIHGYQGENIKAFKICASNFKREQMDEQELKELIATVLDYKLRFVDKEEYIRGIHESIEFELPSVLSVMHVVLEYLLKRVDKVGVVKTEESNLFVALERFRTNAPLHVHQPFVKKFANSVFAWLDIDAPLHFRKEPRALHLSGTLRATEAVPFALPFSRARVALVDDDRPMAGRAFANVAFH
jgi:CheY-like chemotaxis protein